ncbi:Site-specific DNA-methyltransferase (adenine-specific) [Nitrosococcus halophilus Nc 4]|uniref:site-specific DNA-methyltransferase (adenine-specific) n=1 Tax=Nitrosococcus halophilus (strain Nc4) TaxID=472759 RepID=D5BY89_NITHN|nr:class I SAM-dependent DNA methyltransferase [Nitrosococcus halophilus]ADE14072.1 Site-specific DNA-methyltransferase (adenine-specific) [Nitrosococcus halophilus Nc 4]
MAKTADKTPKKTEEPLQKSLWKSADRLRKNMDAAEYKHVVLGLIFLKYISDAFEELHAKLSEGLGEYAGADPEDADEYRAENVFFVPEGARWSYLQARAKLPGIGKDVDEAMEAIEKENPTLKGVLPKQYARQNLDKASLGALIDLLGKIGLGDATARSRDILGRVYEYFLGEFAAAEGKKGGQFYTPAAIVKLLVNMLEPYKGRVYDPCCGSGGMFVQSEKFVEVHQGRIDDISIYGQESNQTTYRLCRMNLAIRGIDGSNVRWNGEGSFLNDAHKDMKAEYIIANPPFNDSDWSGELLRDDPRWQFGVPPVGNANFAWMQHMIYHLAPNGTLGLVLANGSLSSNSGGEGEIRKAIIEAKLVDCIVALPDKLFYNTGIPACLWFISHDRRNHNFRNREDEILFIDARNLGQMITRRNRDFSDEDIARIADTYHAWRNKDGGYEDVKGFCKAATLEDVRKHKHVLTPGRYVGIPDEEDDGVPFEEKMTKLTEELAAQMAQGQALDARIRENLAKVGFGV